MFENMLVRLRQNVVLVKSVISTRTSLNKGKIQ